MFADVMFPISSYRVFTYSVPKTLHTNIRVGIRVRAPIGHRIAGGIVVSVGRKSRFRGKVKPVYSLIDETPVLDKTLWKLVVWMSDYYHAPLGQVAKTVLPQKLTLRYEPRKRYFIELTGKPSGIPRNAIAQKRVLDYLGTKTNPVPVTDLANLVSNPMAVCRVLEKKKQLKITSILDTPDLDGVAFKSIKKEITFTDEQKKVLEILEKPLQRNVHTSFLLHGVTGSGKTEIYIAIIRKAILSGKTAILLLPEISLTPQIAGRFRSEFGDRVALWHSRLTHAARAWTWKEICEGRFSVVIGARSAVFSPLKNLGIIIVDEEQENSYKQEAPAPRYHAREVALMRSKIHGAVTILASATPSLESYYNATVADKFHYLRLERRFGKARYPQTTVIDMKKEEAESGKAGQLFSGVLLEKISERLARNEQVILLQNRRGYSPVMRCRDCGDVFMCPHCQIALVYHRVGDRMQCHFCGHTLYQVPHECDNCRGHNLHLSGSGTQKIEDHLKQFFPEARTLRVDHDTARSGKVLTALLARFARGEADILLGTQMIAKGLDFGRVTLVGIINGDTGMYLPDFRAGERTFQLIYQAAGRAGRRDEQGEVVIQTYQPDNPVITAASLLDVTEFYTETLKEREELGYPPFSWMVRIEISGPKKLDVYDRANMIKKMIGNGAGGIRIKGPVPCYREKLAGRFRQMIILISEKKRDPSGAKLQKYLKQYLSRDELTERRKGVAVVIDINPGTLL